MGKIGGVSGNPYYHGGSFLRVSRNDLAQFRVGHRIPNNPRILNTLGFTDLRLNDNKLASAVRVQLTVNRAMRVTCGEAMRRSYFIGISSEAPGAIELSLNGKATMSRLDKDESLIINTVSTNEESPENPTRNMLKSHMFALTNEGGDMVRIESMDRSGITVELSGVMDPEITEEKDKLVRINVKMLEELILSGKWRNALEGSCDYARGISLIPGFNTKEHLDIFHVKVSDNMRFVYCAVEGEPCFQVFMGKRIDGSIRYMGSYLQLGTIEEDMLRETVNLYNMFRSNLQN